MLSKQQLLDMFEYRDGELYWKITTTNRYSSNRIAGSLHSTGYKYTGIFGKRYKNHRIIWMMHYGYLPKEIDHIDQNKANNRIENLRESNRILNMQNVAIRSNNKSGTANVGWYKPYKKWEVKMRINKKSCHFGYFDDLELASLVAMEAKDKFHIKQAAEIAALKGAQ
jgi:hypothetical protein